MQWMCWTVLGADLCSVHLAMIRKSCAGLGLGSMVAPLAWAWRGTFATPCEDRGAQQHQPQPLTFIWWLGGPCPMQGARAISYLTLDVPQVCHFPEQAPRGLGLT